MYRLIERRDKNRVISEFRPRLALSRIVLNNILIVAAAILDAIGVVGCAILITYIVLITETTTYRESTTRLTELGAQHQELVEAECSHLTPILGVDVGQSLVLIVFVCLNILILAGGVTLAFRERCAVILVRKTGTGHQRCITRYLPIQTGIETSIVVYSIQISCLIHVADRHRALIPLLGLGLVVGIGVVEE